MSYLKLYEVSEEYIQYLQKNADSRILSSKENSRIHNRKYLGIVYNINGYNYYIPLSSPKETDYQIVNGKKVIRRSIIPIIRIVVNNSDGEPELKGTLKISNMIPVPDSELILYNLNNESDLFYKILIQKEMWFIRKNTKKIIHNAKVLYQQKKSNDSKIGYIKNTVDFTKLEEIHDVYISRKEAAVTKQ